MEERPDRQQDGLELPSHFSDTVVPALPRRGWLLMGLVLACFLPRAWEAVHWDAICPDTIYYLDCCRALEEGNLHEAFSELNLNIYPVILLGLRATGLDWQVTGEWFSVLMATLTVLPLFGWIRRQFDDRVAIVACLLYAFHPKFVAYTPLIIRDPAYWFLFALSLYLIWRAILEIRVWLFLAAGLALTLVVHTRFEGWLLLVPLLLWSAARLRAVPGRRRQLVLGTMGTLAVIPLSIVLVNVTLLRDAPCWSLVRPAHQRALMDWTRDMLGLGTVRKISSVSSDPASARGGETAPPVAQTAPTTTADEALLARPLEVSSYPVLMEKTAVRLVKMYSYAFGFVALCGVWGQRRMYVRFEHLVLLGMSLVLFGMVAIRLSVTRIDLRYYVPMILVSFPWMALGILWLSDRFIALTSRWCAWNASKRKGVIAAALVLTIVLGLPEMKFSSAAGMQHQAAIGSWILERLGAGRLVYANVREVILLQYYSHSLLVRYPEHSRNPSPSLRQFLASQSPEVIILWTDEGQSAWADFAQELLRDEALGYRLIARDELPPESGEVCVLVRRDKLGEDRPDDRSSAKAETILR